MKNLGHVNTQSLEEDAEEMFTFHIPHDTHNTPHISNEI